ncbi:M48 family metallopeptidase [Teichococcus aestuarii]|uniref:M48 family metallopeptidase n=1 Tax=Teichococcus aestuarii TaxID=568898 RepID=UPI00361C5568
MLELLRAEAGRRIAPRVRRHAAALAVAPPVVRLKDTRSRWGSCAPDGTLAFSWRLVMAPGWVLDSVVAHEVAHLSERNHSPRFWAQLGRRRRATRARGSGCAGTGRGCCASAEAGGQGAGRGEEGEGRFPPGGGPAIPAAQRQPVAAQGDPP